jgi:hypothetical protein
LVRFGHRAEIESFKFAAGEQPLKFEARKLPMIIGCPRPGAVTRAGSPLLTFARHGFSEADIESTST